MRDADDPALTAESSAQPDLFGPPAAAPVSARIPRALPAFLGGARRGGDPGAPRGHGLAWLAVAALALLLVLQVLLADRARLAADARWRPTLELLCGALGCALPAWHAPGDFTITARDVRPHPSVAGALMITASFRNDGAFAQAWPRVELTLSDLDGRDIATRAFAPRDYLGRPADDERLQPGQDASITLEVVDPGRSALAFRFDFR